MFEPKRRALAAIAAVLVFCTAGQVHAQYPPCTLPMLVVVPTTVQAGGTLTATVTNCRANETVVFHLGSQSVSTTCNPVTLQASAPMTAPPTPGPVSITAQLQGISVADGAAAATQPAGFRMAPAQSATCPPVSQEISLVAQVEVIAQGATTTVPTTIPTTTVPAPSTTIAGGSIPTTGSSGLDSLSTIGAMLLAVGIGLFVVSRLRRRPTAGS